MAALGGRNQPYWLLQVKWHPPGCKKNSLTAFITGQAVLFV
jgi:hypothetical protein